MRQEKPTLLPSATPAQRAMGVARRLLRTRARRGILAAAIAILTRAMVRAHSLTTWDAGLFAAAVVEYDVVAARPHAPGYPVVVAAGKVVHVAVQDPVQAMVWQSILATGAAAALVLILAETIAPRWRVAAGMVAAAVYILSPLVLYNGAVGLSYAAEGAASTLVGWAAWNAARQQTLRTTAAVGLAFSLALGIRQSAIFLMLPLAAWPLLQGGPWRQRIRHAATMAAAAAAGSMAWAAPMFLFGGGAGIVAANRMQAQGVVFRDSVFQSGWTVVHRNLDILAGYMPAELRALALALPAIMVLALVQDRVRVSWRAASFFTAWMAPPLAFYALVYVGDPIFPSGYLMIVAPAAAVGIGCLLAAGIATAWHAGAPRQQGAVMAAALLVLPAHGLLAGWDEARDPIEAADSWRASWQGWQETFPADTTAVLTVTSWRHLMFDAPEHLVWTPIPYTAPNGSFGIQVLETRHGTDTPRYYAGVAATPQAPHKIPDWVTRIVIHEGHPEIAVAMLIKPEVPIEWFELPSGRQVRTFQPDGNWTMIESYLAWTDPAAVQAGGP